MRTSRNTERSSDSFRKKDRKRNGVGVHGRPLVKSTICEAVYIGVQKERHAKCCISIVSVNLAEDQKDIDLNLETLKNCSINKKLSQEADAKKKLSIYYWVSLAQL